MKNNLKNINLFAKRALTTPPCNSHCLATLADGEPTANRRRTDGESHSAAPLLPTSPTHRFTDSPIHRNLKKVAMLLCVLMLGLGQMWGAEAVSLTKINESTEKTYSFISGNTYQKSSWGNTSSANKVSYYENNSNRFFEALSSGSSMGQGTSDGKTGIKLGSSNNGGAITFYVDAACKISFTASTNAKDKTVYLYCDGTTAKYELTSSSYKAEGTSITSFKSTASGIQETKNANLTAGFYRICCEAEWYLDNIVITPPSSSSNFKISVFNSDGNTGTTGEHNFVAGSGDNEIIIENFVIPQYNATGDQKQFWVGNGGYDQQHSANEYFSWKRAYHQQNNGCTDKRTLGDPVGAIGTLHAWTNSTASNYGLCFDPKGYGLMWGQEGGTWTSVPFNATSDATVWLTDIVEISSTQISSYKYYVGLLKSDGGYAGSFRSEGDATGLSRTDNLSGMQRKTGSGDSWASGLTAGTGKFRIWVNNCEQNFYCHFIPYYRATFVNNNGSDNTYSDYKSCEETNQITFPSPTKTGYNLVGWYENGEFSGTKYNAGSTYNLTSSTGSKTFYALWTAKTTTITFDSEGGSDVIGNTATYDAAMVSITPPTKTGYTFAGFYDGDNGTGTQYYKADGTSNKNWNKEDDTATLFAKWTPKTNTKYVVKHFQQKLDGTYPSEPTETEDLTGITDASVTPNTKSYTGFTAPSTQTVTIAANGTTVVTYNYTRKSYTLTWNLDGGSIKTAGTAAGSVKFGASLTAPTVEKTGYTSNGWDPTVPATMPASDATYKATWTAQKYNITYLDEGGSTFSGTHADNYPQKHTYGTATTLKGASKDNFTFDGWFTNSGCTEGPIIELGATAYTNDITLYAKWTAAAQEPEVTWTGVPETVYAGGKYTFSVSTNSDATLDASQLTAIGTASLNKSLSGKTITVTFTMAADAESAPTFTWAIPEGTTTSALDAQPSAITLGSCSGGGGTEIAKVTMTGQTTYTSSGCSVECNETTGGHTIDNEYYVKFSGTLQSGKNYVKLTLNNSSTFAVNDVVTVTYSQTQTATNNQICVGSNDGTSTQQYPFEVANQNTSKTSTYTIKAGDGICGTSIIKVGRYGGSNGSFHSISITRGGSGSGTSATQTPNLTWSNSLADKTTVNKTTTDGNFTYTASSTNCAGTVSYTSDDDKVATVNASTGEVTIVGAGTTTITATIAKGDYGCFTSKSITYTLKVAAAQYAITYKDKDNAEFSGSHESGYPKTHTYGTTTTLKSASKDGFTFDGWFTSSNCSGSAVTELGATAYTDNITLYAKWTATVVPVTGVTLDKNELSLAVGGTETLSATVAPANATNQNVTWSSDDEDVATVANGVVTAVAEGEATITVTTVDGSFTATCTVTVKDASCEPLNATAYFNNNKSDKYNVDVNFDNDVTNVTIDGKKLVENVTGARDGDSHSNGNMALKGSGKAEDVIKFNIPNEIANGKIIVKACTYSNKSGKYMWLTDGSSNYATTSLENTTINNPDGESWSAPTLTTLSYDLTSDDANKIYALRSNQSFYIYEFSINVTIECSEPTTHHVTYAKGDVTCDITLPTQADVAENTTFTVADAVACDGYNFTGWSDGTTTYSAGDSYEMGTSDVTLTAQWEEIIPITTYTITLIPHGVSTSIDGWTLSDGKYIKSGIPSGTEVTLPTLTKSGCEFVQWTNNIGGEPVESSATVTGDLTLHANWHAECPSTMSEGGTSIYTNGCEDEEEVTDDWAFSYSSGSSTNTYPTDKKHGGNASLGMKKTSAGGWIYLTSEESYANVQNCSLYVARTGSNYYTQVEVALLNGTNVVESGTYDLTCQQDGTDWQNITHSFTKQYTDAYKIRIGVKSGSSNSYNAYFDDISFTYGSTPTPVPGDCHYVTYHANAADATGATLDDNAYHDGANTATIAECGYTREGYTFVEWNTDKDGDGTSYTAGQTGVTISADLDLYAVWAPKVVKVNDGDIVSLTAPVDVLIIHQGGQVTGDVTVNERIEYIRPTVGTYSNINQWYTFSVPFTPTDVTIYDKADKEAYSIDAVHGTDVDNLQAGYYYLKTLSAQTVAKDVVANWKYITIAMPAKDKPYIIYFSNEHGFGNYFEINTQVSFIAEVDKEPIIINNTATPQASENIDGFQLVANPTLHNIEVENVYVLNPATNQFELEENAIIPPFECYIQATKSFTAANAIIRFIPEGSFIYTDWKGAGAAQSDKPCKFIENERLMIRYNGQLYDGTGAMLNHVK